jgi:hypothetical protein
MCVLEVNKLQISYFFASMLSTSLSAVVSASRPADWRALMEQADSLTVAVL